MAALDEVIVKDGVDQETVDAVREVGGAYKYGWETEIEMEYAPKGLNEDIVRLISDKNQEPHTKGGCRNCLGAVTVSNNNVERNTAYYAIAHVSKFVPPGSKRINSSSISKLPNVAFNRKIGVFSEIETSPEGLILDRKLFEERKDEWLPSKDDGAFVASLMHAEVRPGHYAGWIAPPKMGIDNKAGDFEFVRIQ